MIQITFNNYTTDKRSGSMCISTQVSWELVRNANY